MRGGGAAPPGGPDGCGEGSARPPLCASARRGRPVADPDVEAGGRGGGEGGLPRAPPGAADPDVGWGVDTAPGSPGSRRSRCGVGGGQCPGETRIQMCGRAVGTAPGSRCGVGGGHCPWELPSQMWGVGGVDTAPRLRPAPRIQMCRDAAFVLGSIRRWGSALGGGALPWAPVRGCRSRWGWGGGRAALGCRPHLPPVPTSSPPLSPPPFPSHPHSRTAESSSPPL